MPVYADVAEEMRVALRKLGLAGHPGVLIALARLRFLKSPCGTACVNMKGDVRIDPEWGAMQAPGQLAYIGLHEMMHLTSLHFDRRADRDPMLWNIAGDLAINGAIEKVIASLPDSDRHLLQRPKSPPGSSGILLPSDEQTKMSTEQLYEELKKGAIKVKATGKFGSGCGPAGDDKGDGSGKELDDIEKQDAARQWRQTSEAAAQVGRGTSTGDAFAKLAEPPPPLTPWEQVLRSVGSLARSAHGYDDRTFKRRHRRSPDSVVLPGWYANSPCVAVLIDSSGSVDDEALAEAVAHTKKISKAQGFRVYFVVHDHEVKHSGWLRDGGESFASLNDKVKGRGGTCFDCAWEEAGKVKTRFDAMVHLTDGEAPWPQDKPTNVGLVFVALVGARHRGPDLPAFAKVIETRIASKVK